MYERCAGVDGHKKTVVAGVVTPAGSATRPCGARTGDGRARSDGLLACGGTPVARERTGDSWKPGLNLLAGTFAVLLVKAQPVTAVPGRQTEAKAAAGLAAL